MTAAETGSVPQRHLVVFADDWGRHPSSAQHLVRHLLDDHNVSWVNTIGTRAPRLTAATMRRIAGKLGQWIRSDRVVPEGKTPRICAPLMYPGFRTAWQRNLNATLLARFMHESLPNLADSVVVSSIPIVADLPDRVRARRWVYYCVDDFSAWPGLDSQSLRAMERKFVARADRIIAAGENLAQRIRLFGRRADVISHGIDPDHWRRAEPRSALLAGLARPIFLYWGLIDKRLDMVYLRTLDAAMGGGTIALVGPEQDPAPELATLAHVHRLGAAPYEALPQLAAGADTLILPYADLEVTRAMQPLKLKEYLATGRPVVSSSLPALAGWEDCLDASGSGGEFARLALLRAGTGTPEQQLVARGRLRSEGWDAKAAVFAELLFGE